MILLYHTRYESYYMTHIKQINLLTASLVLEVSCGFLQIPGLRVLANWQRTCPSFKKAWNPFGPDSAGAATPVTAQTHSTISTLILYH